MESNIISGIIISEFDDIYGPQAKYYIPQDLPKELLNTVSGVTIDSFFNENMKSEALVLVPFPTLNKKGIVKLLEWKDSTKRGSRGNASLTLIFDDKDDPIFYKYIDDFEPPFNEEISRLIALFLDRAALETFEDELYDFQYRFMQVVGTLAEHELHIKESEEFPSASKSINQGLDYRFKIIVIGDPSVGKSSTILRYTDKAFRRSHISTLGVNITQKRVSYQNNECELIFWDCAGQIKFQNVREMYYQGAVGVIIVYDLTNRETFENAEKWYQDVMNILEEPEHACFILCGNKKDRTDEIQVSTEEGQEMASRLKMDFFETSALSGENIDEAILRLVEDLLVMFKENDL